MRSSDESFQAEVLDLRVEMMHKAVLIPLGVAGWLGMALSLILMPTEVTRALTALAFAGVLILVIACAYMAWSGWARPALWTCVLGCALVVPALVVTSQGAISIVWACAACVIAAVLVSPAASWAVTAAVAGICAAVATLRPDFAPPAQVALTVALSVALTYVAQVAHRALLRDLGRINESFEGALEQTEKLRNQSAQLEMALKSLGQTSFALARANEQLEIMVQFAEEARRSKQEFAANISHELRTPLNLIIGFSEVILYSPSTYYADQLPPKLLADIHTIYRNAQHLLRLVNDILDLSQMDVNYMTIAREPMQAADVIQSALSDFDELIRARGLALAVDVAPDLPELYADRTRIRQVLLNLFNNALRFTDRGGITVSARSGGANEEVTGWQGDKVTSVTSSPPHPVTPSPPHPIIFTVADTGSGIAEADLQRIFEPFTQVDGSPSRRYGGSGLGLTISKRFVELHGGRMWVESRLGQGSAFHFTIPAAVPIPLASTGLTAHALHRREVGALVVVERSPLVSRLLKRYLAGIDVVQVASLDELRNAARTILPEAVIVNEPFGGLPGAGEWPDELKHVPVFHCRAAGPIAQTGARVDGADMEEPGRMVVSLFKPVMREHLYAVIAEMAQRASANGRAPGAPVPAEEEAGETAVEPGRARRPFRMLVVEDDEDALRLFGRLLRLAPREARGEFDAIVPVELNCGEDAIQYLRTPDGQSIDGALLDIRLGATTGFEVLSEIEKHERLRHVPVCFTTGGDLTDQPLVTPHLTVSKQDGLTASELIQATAALMQLMLPGLSVSALSPGSPPPWAETKNAA